MIKHIKVWIYIDKNQRRPCYFIICFPFSSSFQSLAYLGFLSFCKNTAAVVLQKARDLEKLYELVSDNQFSCTGAFKLSPLIFLMFQRTEILLSKEIWPSANKSTNMDYIRKCNSHWMSHSTSLYIAVSCTLLMIWNREDWLLRYTLLTD